MILDPDTNKPLILSDFVTMLNRVLI